MKTLILMRHAKSDWSVPGQRDFDRALNGRGTRSAKALGRWLADHGHSPDLALVSSARRTRDTWAGVAAELAHDCPVRFSDRLYHAAPEAMLDILRRQGRDSRCVLMLGHNPATGSLATYLAGASAPAHPDFSRYPTAATTVMDFPESEWSDIGMADVRDFIVPRDLI